MRRFALFVAALIIIVGIGSQPWPMDGAIKSMCVCVPARAGLILRSMTSRSAMAKTHVSSVRRLAIRAIVAQ